MKLTIRHLTEYAYEPEVQRVTLRLRLSPADTTAQRIGGWQVTVNGRPAEPMFVNAHGDAEALATVAGPVKSIEIAAGGKVTTTDRNGLVDGLRSSVPPPAYLRATKATRATAAVRAFAEANLKPGGPLETAHALSGAVTEAVVYRAGRTTMATTASEALEAGEGVCQDQAHVLIAAARALGLPARYVAGYLNGAPAAGEGEADVALATHGWAELLVDGIGWIGFDPSNEVCTTDDYVRLCSGFDAHDAAPVRGSIHGPVGKEELAATVHVADDVAGGQAQSQEQQ